tara:strand:+ start:30 stop:455 length:426 start_codon:yes stop_codon:yes gene_type:complete
MADLEVQVGATVRITDDVAAAFDAARPGVAMRVGGYGPSSHNFHRDAMVRRGFGEAADRITELFAAGRRGEAAAAVPDDYLDDGALVGSRQRIAERFQQWRSTLATGLTVRPTSIDEMEFLAELAGCEPRPDVEVPPGPVF